MGSGSMGSGFRNRGVVQAVCRPRGRRGIGVLALAAVLLALPSSPLSAETPGDAGSTRAAAGPAIVARVDGEPIYRAEFAGLLERAGFSRVSSPQERRMIAAKAIEDLVNQRLLQRLFKKRGVSVEDAEVDRRLEGLREQLAGRGTSLEAMLASTGRDEAALREQMATDMAISQLLTPLLTSQRLQDVFEQHRRSLDGTRLRLSHILLRPDAAHGEQAFARRLEQAKSIRAAIQSGSIAFEDAARLHSAGPSRRRGGDLGFFSRKGPHVESFLAAAFALQPGEVSEPLATPFGIHLITITDEQPGKAGLQETRSEVEQILARSLLAEMLAKERAEAEIVFAAGLPHLSAPQPGDPEAAREVVVEPAAVGSGDRG